MEIINPKSSDEWACPVCGKSDLGPVFEIPVKWSDIPPVKYHVDCIDLKQLQLDNQLILHMSFEDRREV